MRTGDVASTPADIWVCHDSKLCVPNAHLQSSFCVFTFPVLNKPRHRLKYVRNIGQSRKFGERLPGRKAISFSYAMRGSNRSPRRRIGSDNPYPLSPMVVCEVSRQSRVQQSERQERKKEARIVGERTIVTDSMIRGLGG